MAADAAGAGPGRLRGGADWVRACACVCRRRGSAVLSRRRRGSGRRPTGSRPTGATPSGWRGCFGSVRSRRYGCPTPEEEAARDLVRAREDARGDLMRARHRLSKLLLRHGLVYDATAWTRAHDVWLRRQRFQSGPLAIVFDECYGRMLDAKTRRDALDKAIAELAATPPYVDVVSRLVCLRGVSTLTAFALTVELGDWHRFRPESLGPFLGLTPSENSSGERRRQGAITKAGNSHVRRLLIEAAWHHRRPSAHERHARTQTHRQAARCASPSRPQRPPAAPTLARARGPRQAPHDHRRRRRARTRRPLLGTRDDGVAATPNGSARRAHRRNDARSDPREH